ncbi:MAG: SPASM domain-containing protein [Bacteroidales bacterium]|nr:SPASM domain-containing protein [Bacteroidales bacterium]
MKDYNKAFLFDGWRFLSKLTYKRIFNLLKLKLSYLISRISGRSVHWGKPFSASIEPTTLCNLHCPECPSGLRKFSRPTGKLELDLFQKYITELGDQMMYLILYFQGEPFLNPHFFEFVKYAKSRKLYTATSTNGHFLSEQLAQRTVYSGLDRLIISLDGTDAATYLKYRSGGDYEKVIQGIRNIVKAKKDSNFRGPFIVLQFIIFGTNEHQLEDIKILAKELGVDKLELKTAQVYEFEEGNPLIPKNERYSRYQKQADGQYRIKSKMPNRCYRMWSGTVVTWDGSMVPCCFDKDADHVLGSLNDHSFQQIWKGENYHQFRSTLHKGRKHIDICQNCIEGL